MPASRSIKFINSFLISFDKDEGSSTLEDRAQKEVKELLGNYEPSSLSNEIKKELINLMEHEAGKFNQETLPMRDE